MYKEDILPYKRVVEERSEPRVSFRLISFTHILLYLSALLISRVVMLKTLMPFGIAFLVAVFAVLNKQEAFITGIFVVIGYILSFQKFISISHAATALILLLFIPLLSDENKIYKFAAIAFFVNMISNIFFHYKYISLTFLFYDAVVAIFESIILIASAYIFAYGIPFYFNKTTRKILSREEIICLILTLSIVVSGVWDINIYNYSLKNIISFLVVICFGYSEGAAMGAAVGITLGIVSGIYDMTMHISLGIFGFVGMISGVFKDFNKIIVSISFIIASAMISFYSYGSIALNNIIMESIIASILFVLLPIKKFQRFTSSLDGDKKTIELQKSYIEKVKGLMEIKLASMSNTLYGMSSILQENIENELAKKTEINSLVEKLADRVCANCDMRSLCWDKDLYYTYDSFVELLRVIEKRGMISTLEMPEGVRRKCIRPTEIMKQSVHLLEIMRLNNRWRKSL